MSFDDFKKKCISIIAIESNNNEIENFINILNRYKTPKKDVYRIETTKDNGQKYFDEIDSCDINRVQINFHEMLTKSDFKILTITKIIK